MDVSTISVRDASELCQEAVVVLQRVTSETTGVILHCEVRDPAAAAGPAAFAFTGRAVASAPMFQYTIRHTLDSSCRCTAGAAADVNDILDGAEARVVAFSGERFSVLVHCEISRDVQFAFGFEAEGVRNDHSPAVLFTTGPPHTP